MPSSELLSTEEPSARALVIAIQTPFQTDNEVSTSLDELRQLMRGLGIPVEASVVQRRHDNRDLRVLGSGKLEEVQALLGTGPSDEEETEAESET